MPTLQCKDYPIRRVLVDTERLSALLINTRKGVIQCEGQPVDVEFFELLVDKTTTYNAFKRADYITYCKSTKREVGISEAVLNQIERHGDVLLIASARYNKPSGTWISVNTANPDFDRVV